MAPARQFKRAGVFVMVLLAGGACDRVRPGGGEEGPRVLELAHDTIRLESGVRLWDVVVQRQAAGDFEPAALEARTGDMVRFITEDRAGHAIVFVGPELVPGAAEFLEQTGQMRSPPLIEAGSSWVITLENAPVGTYPFHCTTHNVRGTLTVAAREP